MPRTTHLLRAIVNSLCAYSALLCGLSSFVVAQQTNGFADAVHLPAYYSGQPVGGLKNFEATTEQPVAAESIGHRTPVNGLLAATQLVVEPTQPPQGRTSAHQPQPVVQQGNRSAPSDVAPPVLHKVDASGNGVPQSKIQPSDRSLPNRVDQTPATRFEPYSAESNFNSTIANFGQPNFQGVKPYAASQRATAAIPQIVVIRVATANVNNVLKMLQQFYPDRINGGGRGGFSIAANEHKESLITLAADADSNSIIVRGRAEDIDEISRLIDSVDNAGTGNDKVKVLKTRESTERLPNVLSGPQGSNALNPSNTSSSKGLDRSGPAFALASGTEVQNRPQSDRPQNDRPQNDRPQNDRPQNDRPQNAPRTGDGNHRDSGRDAGTNPQNAWRPGGMDNPGHHAPQPLSGMLRPPGMSGYPGMPGMQDPTPGPSHAMEALDHMLKSPVVKQILELKQENLELKAEMKIHEIEMRHEMKHMEMQMQFLKERAAKQEPRQEHRTREHEMQARREVLERHEAEERRERAEERESRERHEEEHRREPNHHEDERESAERRELMERHQAEANHDRSEAMERRIASEHRERSVESESRERSERSRLLEHRAETERHETERHETERHETERHETERRETERREGERREGEYADTEHAQNRKLVEKLNQERNRLAEELEKSIQQRVELQRQLEQAAGKVVEFEKANAAIAQKLEQRQSETQKLSSELKARIEAEAKNLNREKKENGAEKSNANTKDASEADKPKSDSEDGKSRPADKD